MVKKILYLNVKKGSRKLINLRHKLAKTLSPEPVRSYAMHISLGYLDPKQLHTVTKEIKAMDINLPFMVDKLVLMKNEDDKRTVIWKNDYFLV
jgi:2'-5' RNA ligase